MTDQKPTEEQLFRSALEDLVPLAKALSEHCQTVEEMIGMAQLAIKNDGQLRLLISACKQKQ